MFVRLRHFPLNRFRRDRRRVPLNDGLKAINYQGGGPTPLKKVISNGCITFQSQLTEGKPNKARSEIVKLIKHLWKKMKCDNLCKNLISEMLRGRRWNLDAEVVKAISKTRLNN